MDGRGPAPPRALPRPLSYSFFDARVQRSSAIVARAGRALTLRSARDRAIAPEACLRRVLARVLRTPRGVAALTLLCAMNGRGAQRLLALPPAFYQFVFRSANGTEQRERARARRALMLRSARDRAAAAEASVAYWRVCGASCAV